MSVKIKISYQDPQELQKVLGALRPLGITCKAAKQQGAYKRAYVEVNEESERCERSERFKSEKMQRNACKT